MRHAATARRPSPSARPVVSTLVVLVSLLLTAAGAAAGEVAPQEPVAAATARSAVGGAGSEAPVSVPWSTQRLAGGDRYASAAAIVRHSFRAPPVPVAFVVTGRTFADVLAAGPAARALGGPVLPVTGTRLPEPVRTELARLHPGRIVVLGGPSAVSEAIARELDGLTAGTVTRLAGSDRFGTAARVATTTFPGPVPHVLVATGAAFADALAGGAAAAKVSGPVLLVTRSGVPAETSAALRRLRPRSITVLGGTDAVSEDVAQALRAFTEGGSVTRVSGADRYDTAARLARAYWPNGAGVVYLATGRDFPDALAGIPAAGRDDAPLLLLEPGCMPSSSRAELDRLRPTFVIALGGTSTLSDAAVRGQPCAVAPPPSGQPTPTPTPVPGIPAGPAGGDCLDFAAQPGGPRAVRIVFAGSSTTQTSGYGYVSQTLARLRAAHPGGTTAAVQYSASATFAALSDDVGLHAYNVGQGGTTAADYLTAAERTRIAALAPSMVMHMIGANDFANDVPVATYKANVRAALADLQAKAPATCVQVLVHSYERFDAQVRDGTLHPWSAYGRALEEIAASNPGRYLYIDATPAFISAGVPGPDPSDLVGADDVHATQAGHQLLSTTIAARILGSRS